MKNNKYYAVLKGRKTGIFTTWEDCKKSIDKYSGAEYKSFNSEDEANVYLNKKNKVNIENNGENNSFSTFVENDEKNVKNTTEKQLSIYVDGSYDKKTNKSSYGVVIIDSKKIISKFGGVSPKNNFSGNNVVGEVFGVLMALDWCIKHKITNQINIFFDYIGLEKWLKDDWKTKSDIANFYKTNALTKIKKLKNVNFIKVKAHSNDEYNDLADFMAKKSLGLAIK